MLALGTVFPPPAISGTRHLGLQPPIEVFSLFGDCDPLRTEGWFGWGGQRVLGLAISEPQRQPPCLRGEHRLGSLFELGQKEAHKTPVVRMTGHQGWTEI
jgi:hypothetical protein